MKSRLYTLALAGLVLLWANVSCHARGRDDQSTRRPNILLILVDDLGWSDFGCYGSEIQTPTIDGLAFNGLRYRQFYNAARCAPTRCSLLTGLYTQQVATNPGQSLPPLRTDNNVTMAELLGTQGYRTYMSGKWHLGKKKDGRDPRSRGFQHVFGMGTHCDGANVNSYWNINIYGLQSQNNDIAWRPYTGQQFHQTDAIGDYALDFLDHHRAQGDMAPFFLYMPFNATHWPIHAPAALANKYTDAGDPHPADDDIYRYEDGWDVTRQRRYERQLAMGIIDERYVLSPKSDALGPVEPIPAWTSLSVKRQQDLARRMALYAGMIEQIDRNIAKVTEWLARNEQLDNTLIMLLADNGGNYEGGLFGNPVARESKDLAAMGQSGDRNKFPRVNLGGGWANVNNTPYRLYKHFVHDGGIRTPFIVHWPAGISDPNRWVEDPGHLVDIMATIAEVTGAAYPSQHAGHPVLPREGVSLVPNFSGGPLKRRQIGFEHERNRAWIDGPWKFVTKNFTFTDGSSPAHELELYDMRVDPTEMNNLALQEPERLAAMTESWNAWARRVGVPADRLLSASPSVGVDPPIEPTAEDLFLDTFGRPNQSDIDNSSDGMSGLLLPQLGAKATYYEGFEGSGAVTSMQILHRNLQMAVGNGMSETGLQHNFVDPAMVAAGGFSIEMNILEINSSTSDATNRYAGFAVGLTQAEAAAGADVGKKFPPYPFRGKTGNPVGIADCFVELDITGHVKLWSHGQLVQSVDVGVNHGILKAEFALHGFDAQDDVTVTVWFNGKVLDMNPADSQSRTQHFKWERANTNYIGLSARASNYVVLDNFVVRSMP